MPRELPFILALMCRIGMREFTLLEANEERIPLPLPIMQLKA